MPEKPLPKILQPFQRFLRKRNQWETASTVSPIDTHPVTELAYTVHTEGVAKDVIARLRPIILEEASKRSFVTRYEQLLDDRLLVEDVITRDSREDTERDTWSLARGDYHNTRGAHPRTNSENYQLTDPLSGLEQDWEEQIDKALDAKAATGQPVILMDFGGGLGHSVIRLASQEKYRDAIEKGDLVLIVTNLGLKPSREVDADGYTGIAKGMNSTNHLDPKRSRAATNYTRSDLQFIQKYQHRVNFIDANALELTTATITTNTGKEISLLGNVDVINEESAVMHTHVPDLVLGIFAELLSPTGTVYLDAKKSNYMHGPQVQYKKVTVADGRTIYTDTPTAQGTEYYNIRGIALEVGVATLQRLGVHLVVDNYLGPAVYSKRNSN